MTVASHGQRLPEQRNLYDRGTLDPATRTADHAAKFHGEFEQRFPGHHGTGPARQTGSDAELRRELCRRVSVDPRLANESIDIAVERNSVVLGGTLRRARQREWLCSMSRPSASRMSAMNFRC